MAGWTRQQIATYHKRQLQKQREYEQLMKPKWEERRIAVGMLLDAIWDYKLGCFRRLHRSDKHGAWFRCWDRHGNEIEARMLF